MNWDALPLVDGNSRALWPVIFAVAVIVVCVMLINWTRIWVKASKKPFRYTYSIAEFKPIEDGSAGVPTSGHAAVGTEETEAGGEPAEEELAEEGEYLAEEGGGEPAEEGGDVAEASGGEPAEQGGDRRKRAGDLAEASGEPAEGEAETRESEYDEEPLEEEPGDDTGGTTPLSWLVQDLTERLSRRIGRLSLLDVEYAERHEEAVAHPHRRDVRRTRENAQGVWNVEVLPTVRIGGTKSRRRSRTWSSSRSAPTNTCA